MPRKYSKPTARYAAKRKLTTKRVLSVRRAPKDPRVHNFVRDNIAVRFYNTAAGWKVDSTGGVPADIPLIIGATSTDICPNTVQGGFTWVQRLASIDNFATLTNAYDAYRIDEVELHIRLMSSTGALIIQQAPTFMYCLDVDDANIPATDNEIRGRRRVRYHTFSGGKPLVIKFKPQLSALNYADTLSTVGYGPNAGWVDSNSSRTDHYGLKGWINMFAVDPAGTGIVYTYLQIESKVTLRMRDPI